VYEKILVIVASPAFVALLPARRIVNDFRARIAF